MYLNRQQDRTQSYAFMEARSVNVPDHCTTRMCIHMFKILNKCVEHKY